MYSFVGISLTHATEHVLDYDNDVSWLVDYEDYEQQKQRADELEKQNNILKHNIRVELDSSRNMYIGMCGEKLRADRAEKRWSELKDTVNEFHQEAIIEVSKCKDEGDKGIVYSCEKILGKISDLEEDGE